MNLEFHIIANAALGKGLSGSDRIFIELSRNLHRRGHRVTVYVWEEGHLMCLTQNLKGVKFVIWKVGVLSKFGFAITYIYRIVNSIVQSLQLKLENDPKVIVYSASDFWMDSLPAWILKMRLPKIRWVGTYYLAAPNPFYGFREEGRKVVPSIKDSFYWLMQRLPYFLIKKYSDLVCVTSEPDMEKFPSHKMRGAYLVIKGGVDLKKIKPSKNFSKIYSAVFQGRFHKQKGVLELVQIWRKVVDKIPNARLAMIGDGPLMENVKLQITNYKLQKNILLFGFLLDGAKKNQIFLKSKIVVHPAIYDSGGMAAAEAMAFGLPGVSFDLKALRSYYPKGLLKANISDTDDFANKILQLLKDKDMYKKMSSQVIKMIQSEWSWEKRTDQFLSKIYELA